MRKIFKGINVGDELIAALEEVRDMVKKEKRKSLEEEDRNS